VTSADRDSARASVQGCIGLTPYQSQQILTMRKDLKKDLTAIRNDFKLALGSIQVWVVSLLYLPQFQAIVDWRLSTFMYCLSGRCNCSPVVSFCEVGPTVTSV
jgi:hypothetical protein